MKYSIKSLASEAVIYGLANALNKASVLLLVPLYAKVFSPELFGVIHLINNVYLLVGMTSLLALDNSVAIFFYNHPEEKEQQAIFSQWVYSVLGINLVLSVCGLIFSSSISFWLTGSDEYASLIQLASCNLLFVFLPYIVSFWFRLQRKPWQNAWYQCGGALLGVLLNMVFILALHRGIVGFFEAQLAASVLQTLVGFYLFKNRVTWRMFRFNRWMEMFKISYPLIFYGIAAWILAYSSVYFVKAYVKDLNQVGVFQFGVLIASGMGFVVNAFGQAWGPFVHSIKNSAEATSTYAKVMKIYALFVSLIITLMAIFLKEIIVLISTENYLNASGVTILLMFHAAFTGFGFIAATGFQIGQTVDLKIVGWMNALGALITIGLFVVSIPMFGPIGAAMATLTVNMSVVLYLFYRAHDFVQIPYPFVLVAFIVVVSFMVSWSAHLFLPVHAYIWKISLGLFHVFFLYGMYKLKLQSTLF